MTTERRMMMMRTRMSTFVFSCFPVQSFLFIVAAECFYLAFKTYRISGCVMGFVNSDVSKGAVYNYCNEHTTY